MEEVEIKTENAPTEPAEAAAAGTAEPMPAEPAEAAGEESIELGPAAEPAEAPAAESPEPAEPTDPAEVAEGEAQQMVLDAQPLAEQDDTGLRAVIEAIVYITEEPVTPAQIATALNCPQENVKRVLDELAAEYARSVHGIMLREVAGGFKLTTKPEHHETIRDFVKSLTAPLKLSLAALETLATIAYKQPITAPEIMEIRGVQGAGVLKTLLDRKLIQTSGRKNVIGRPILYKTTKEFLVQFGLKDLSELPTLKEFEELRRLSISEPESESETQQAPAEPAATSEPPAAEAPAEPAAAPEPPAEETSAEPAARTEVPAEPGTEEQDV